MERLLQAVQCTQLPRTCERAAVVKDRIKQTLGHGVDGTWWYVTASLTLHFCVSRLFSACVISRYLTFSTFQLLTLHLQSSFVLNCWTRTEIALKYLLSDDLANREFRRISASFLVLFVRMFKLKD